MQTLTSKILAQVGQVVLGKPEQIKLALACVLAKGHMLIEDLPGMGKTTLAHTLSISLGLSYQRTQFTSDLLPSDVVGISIFNTDKQSFELHPGPIFNQVVLADEINRASPKTQSALLEAMEEGRVSIDGKTHQLPQPFLVIATQNPLFHSGTYPLPESQLDRFMMKLSLGFPEIEAEKLILTSDNRGSDFSNIKACVTGEQLVELQRMVQSINVSDSILEYVIALAKVTRNSDFNGNPLSPRAAKALLHAAKAWAFINERDYVLPDDIKSVFVYVCEHRISPAHESVESGSSSLSNHVLAQVDVVTPL